MPTTTNYSWTTPADTDLVKDGASAIRTLGTAIDTTTKNLNPSTTLGDIQYRSSTANTNTRLGIGSTGQVLTVSGGVPAWATPSSGGMTSIASGTLSGTTVTISSISGSYVNLVLYIIGAKAASAGGALFLRLNNISTASSYKWTWVNTDGTAVNNNSDTKFFPNAYSVTSTTNTSQAQLIISNYSAASSKKCVTIQSSVDGTYGMFGAGIQNTITDAIDRIDISNENGVSFNGGTYVLYGVK